VSTIKVDAIQKLNGSVPKAGDLGLNITGTVLQVVQGTYSTSLDTSSTSFVDLGLNASITPSSTSSKIWIMFDVHFEIRANNRGCGIQLNRDSTALISGTEHEFYHLDAGINRARAPYHYLDSPSSTSAINYNVKVKVYNGEIRFCNDSNSVRITLMEIAG
jgi:hypothetical protein